ncbi:protein containing NADH:flavin oxidoreductase/NADH oxidase [Candidatus Magnetomorum sp. HK-1]|nr:protein containing NADH:flavin oxidoreductase/NADH oxidase [Candidatus Magnetomorum sp. HK-1]
MTIPNIVTPLFEKHGIGSRFFLAPINTGMTEWNSPSLDLINFHTERSSKYIGLNYIGNVAIDYEYMTNDRNLVLLQNNTTTWIKLIESIYSHGSIPAIQFACLKSKIIPQKSWIGNCCNYLINARDEFVNFNIGLFERIFDKFIENIKVAYDIGVRIFQIHAAHGYFLSNLINHHINKRNDQFSYGDFYFFDKLVDILKNEFNDILLDIRISVYKGIDNKRTELADTFQITSNLIKSGFDIISFSNGIYNVNKEYIYPPKQWGHAFYLEALLSLIKLYPDTIFNYAGNIWNIEQLNTIPNNLSFSIGRSLISDPDIVRKFYKKEENKINGCNNCDGCHYYSLGKKQLLCSNWREQIM